MLDRVHRLIRHEKIPPKSVIDLLTRTYIGTNGTLYQLLDTKTKIHKLHQPHFIFIERNNKAIGNMTICQREVMINHEKTPSNYIRYFAFDQLFHGGSQKGKGSSQLHQYFKALFDTSNFDPVNPEKDPSIYWAFIDPDNIRSFNMNERFGFETIGQFKTLAFSRVNPKNRNISALREVEKTEVMAEIKSFYADHQFFSPIHLFDDNNYYVLRKDGQIIAGIQANPVKWKIKSLPGISGRFLLQSAPYIPRIRKLINPNNHEFLATEGLFWKKGFEHEVQNLLEGVLAETKHHSLLIWQDLKDESLKGIPIKWGFIQRIKQDNTIHIVAKINGHPADTKESFQKKPFYLSGFDMT